MPKLKLYIFDYEGPEPAKMLEEALGTVFPAGLPAGATVVTAGPVEEPTDIEPLDEPTAVEEPTSTPSPSPAPQPEPRPHTGGRTVPIEELQRTVDAIASELIVMEPQTPAMLAKRTSFRAGIIAEALRDDRFRKTGGGYALAPLKR